MRYQQDINRRQEEAGQQGARQEERRREEVLRREQERLEQRERRERQYIDVLEGVADLVEENQELGHGQGRGWRGPSPS